jgi:DNA-binding transcriptional ArsR family regulator
MSDLLASLSHDIEDCQYRCMSIPLTLLDPAGTVACCSPLSSRPLSQPTISHHLKMLHDAGLLDRDKRGVWVYYRARTQALASLGALIGCPPS